MLKAFSLRVCGGGRQDVRQRSFLRGRLIVQSHMPPLPVEFYPK
jgi:hypothetical protein